jgi:membrane protein DedA with SNARE-associated domain
VVFFGRFVVILRPLAAFLAGANRMALPRFLAFNAAGGIIWAAAYGFGAYTLGSAIHRLIGPIGITLAVATVLLIVAGAIFIRKHEKRLKDEAQRALPGPIAIGSATSAQYRRSGHRHDRCRAGSTWW